MVSFNAATHTYTNDLTGERYLSCTQLLSRYKKKFDSELHATRVARKRGTTKEAVLAEWATNTKARCDYGTSIHEAIEEYILEGTVQTGFEKCINKLEEIVPYKKKRVRPEFLVYSHEYKIAGTSDIIEDVNDEYFNVFDFKTNKEFTFENKYKEHLLTPLSHLTSCDYNAYAIQLSLYAALYSGMTEKKLNKIGILYWSEHDETWTLYPVPYMKHEVLLLLQHYKKNSV